MIEDVDESAFSRDDSGKDAGSAARIDEEEMMEGGLRGRFSAGGEVYFSAKQRSFGSELCDLQGSHPVLSCQLVTGDW